MANNLTADTVSTTKLQPFINYGGNCRQAFQFYEQHLGGKITMMMTRGQLPDEQNPLPQRKDDVLHARILIAGAELMGSDVPPDRFQPMRSAYLCLTSTRMEQAESLYSLLSEGGEIFMPMQAGPSGIRFGMLRDKFGTSWMILFEPETR